MKLNFEDFISPHEYEEYIKKMDVHIISVFNILNNEETHKTEKAQMLLAAMNTLDNDREKAVFISTIISYYQAALLKQIRRCNSMAEFSVKLLEILESRGVDVSEIADRDDSGAFS